MKLLELSKDERQTLGKMEIFHPQPRMRMRVEGILRLSQGLTLQQIADEFTVHLNSVEQWRQPWNKFGLAGLLRRSPQWSAKEVDVGAAASAGRVSTVRGRYSGRATVRYRAAAGTCTGQVFLAPICQCQRR